MPQSLAHAELPLWHYLAHFGNLGAPLDAQKFLQWYFHAVSFHHSLVSLIR